MKKLAFILVSLILSTLLHFGGALVGSIVTGVVTGKSPHEVVWLLGGCYAPFFVCGMVLAATRGFQFPRILVPCGAFAVVVLFVAENSERLNLLERSLLLAAVPVSFVGCLTSQAWRNRRPANGSDGQGSGLGAVRKRSWDNQSLDQPADAAASMIDSSAAD